jgi:flagellar basal-body rod protein FlgC
MELDRALALSASGLEVQRRRMNVIASNLANVNSTKSLNGLPYRRRDLLVRADSNFGTLLNRARFDATSPFAGSGTRGVDEAPGVRAVKVVEDKRPPRQVYDPQHPDANAQGYVLMPDINTIEEMVNLITASRAYEANITAMNITKTMAQRALEIGR